MATIHKISISVIFILSVFLWIIWQKNIKLQYDNLRLGSNYEIVQKRSNRAQELTELEFKDFYKKYDSIANLLKIKSKNIQNVIVTLYRYKDSTITKCITVIDTVNKKISFSVSEPNGCYAISGFVSPDSVVWVNGVQINDKLEVFLYSEKDKWFWKINKFWQYPKNKALIYSECKNDTIQVIDNIKIIKK